MQYIYQKNILKNLWARTRLDSFKNTYLKFEAFEQMIIMHLIFSVCDRDAELIFFSFKVFLGDVNSVPLMGVFCHHFN